MHNRQMSVQHASLPGCNCQAHAAALDADAQRAAAQQAAEAARAHAERVQETASAAQADLAAEQASSLCCSCPGAPCVP